MSGGKVGNAGERGEGAWAKSAPDNGQVWWLMGDVEVEVEVEVVWSGG